MPISDTPAQNHRNHMRAIVHEWAKTVYLYAHFSTEAAVTQVDCMAQVIEELGFSDLDALLDCCRPHVPDSSSVPPVCDPALWAQWLNAQPPVGLHPLVSHWLQTGERMPGTCGPEGMVTALLLQLSTMPSELSLTLLIENHPQDGGHRAELQVTWKRGPRTLGGLMQVPLHPSALREVFDTLNIEAIPPTWTHHERTWGATHLKVSRSPALQMGPRVGQVVLDMPQHTLHSLLWTHRQSHAWHLWADAKSLEHSMRQANEAPAATPTRPRM